MHDPKKCLGPLPNLPDAARRWSNICHSLSWPKLISVLLVIFSAENHCRPNKWLLHFASSGNRYELNVFTYIMCALLTGITLEFDDLIKDVSLYDLSQILYSFLSCSPLLCQYVVSLCSILLSGRIR